MTTILLIRHAEHGLLGKRMAGRSPGVHLSEEGRTHAQELGRRIGAFDAIYTSPLERCQETAGFLDGPVSVDGHLIEFDFGDWTMLSLDELEADPEWRQFNQFRSGARVPGGETMSEVQSRMVSAMLSIRDRHPGQRVAIVSHGDPIKTVLMHFLGMPLELFLRFEIEPASVSELVLGDDFAKVLRLNWRPEKV